MRTRGSAAPRTTRLRHARRSPVPTKRPTRWPQLTRSRGSGGARHGDQQRRQHRPLLPADLPDQGGASARCGAVAGPRRAAVQAPARVWLADGFGALLRRTRMLRTRRRHRPTQGDCSDEPIQRPDARIRHVHRQLRLGGQEGCAAGRCVCGARRLRLRRARRTRRSARGGTTRARSRPPPAPPPAGATTPTGRRRSRRTLAASRRSPPAPRTRRDHDRRHRPACWGANDDGQTTIPPNLGSVTQITAGALHTCAITTVGTPACWGRNLDGQTAIPPNLGSVTQIAAGNYHTCAITTAATPACWASTGTADATPPNLGSVTQITAGVSHTCAITTAGTPACWGYNGYGQTTIAPNLGSVTQISAGVYHTCAVTTAWAPPPAGATTSSGRRRSRRTSAASRRSPPATTTRARSGPTPARSAGATMATGRRWCRRTTRRARRSRERRRSAASRRPPVRGTTARPASRTRGRAARRTTRWQPAPRSPAYISRPTR